VVLMSRVSNSRVANRHGYCGLKTGLKTGAFATWRGNGEVVKVLSCFLTNHIHVVGKGQAKLLFEEVWI
ncbi:MAG: hypothetical protein LUG83_02765, partial [Lachnospiraceae bacterium]|nr:hypothetical protein [Lachnospiraceae bacterium]